MKNTYQDIHINENQAAKILQQFYNIEGEIKTLPGYDDFNFKITTKQQSYILKVCRPNVDQSYIQFQQALLNHIAKSDLPLNSPTLLPNSDGKFISEITDTSGNIRMIRLLTWMEGRLWSNVNPQKEELLYNLGEQAGLLTKSLTDFDHPFAYRKFEWDLAESAWTCDYVDLLNKEQKEITTYFQNKFKAFQIQYKSLRKSVVHSDVNNMNIIVTENLLHPKVKAMIDFGDAIHTQIINDLAIAIAYAMIDKEDVLNVALPIVSGYHKNFPLEENEIKLLYTLVAMRLIVTATKSAIARQEEPDNEYLFVSEKPAWKILRKWILINDNFVYYRFREACGFTPHPNQKAFENWAEKQDVSIFNLFLNQKRNAVQNIDMSIESTWLGHEVEYNDNELLKFKTERLQKQNPNSIIAGGYLETRPFYSTDAYKKEGNNGAEYRTVHLGVDVWLPAQTPIHAPFDGKIFSIYDNANDKDYGPTLILEHKINNEFTFYTLFGHLSKSSLYIYKSEQSIKKGDVIGYIGNSNENGNWAAHLHFQLVLDLLENKRDFPGVAFPTEINTWKSICPNPNLFFKEKKLETKKAKKNKEIISYRKKHLGKSLSLSYEQALKIVRGSGAFLIDANGQRYLDTVNNVAHVGHEHPNVVKAGQNQMAILNTNTRYLHENINNFAKELLTTFPEKLSVVHFLNSGSEANELALRMAKAATNQKDIIAIEVGYHGNTNACIEISSYKFDGKGGSGAPAHTHIVPLPDTYRGLYTNQNAAVKYAAHVETQVKKIQAKGRNIAAFICESIISCGGQIELPKDYLKIAYEAVRKAGGICIADEVQVGCGRVGSHFWGFQLHGVVPDIVTIGKPIGNGHPLAAVVCTQSVANAFANGMEYFNTFGGNPVSCAIGSEVLNIIKKEKLQENAKAVGDYLKSALQELQKKFPIIGHVRGQGLFLGFELVDKNNKPLANHANYLANRMKELKILMSTDGKDHNVLKIKPPMVFSLENAAYLIDQLEKVLKEDFIKL